jgi:hypothetical protein
MWKIAIITVALSACADPTLEGTYEGRTTGMEYPPTWTVKITKQTTGDGVTTVEGTWGIEGIGISAGGSISGTFADPELTLTFTSASTSNCGYSIDATWRGDEIEGSYAAMACFVTATGSFTLSRK